MARKSVSLKGEAASVSHQKVNEIVQTVLRRYPADAAIAVAVDVIGAGSGYPVQ